MHNRPILDQFNLVVSDMETSVSFYRRLGLTITDADEWGDHHRSAAMDGGIDLDFDSERFASRWNVGWPNRGQMGVLGFRVSSREAVDEIYEDLIGAGSTGQQPPYDAFWGSRYAVVEDPDGHAIGIMSPPDPARRSSPPPL